MRISIITLFPKMVSCFFEESIIKRAIDKKLVEIEIINLRDFAVDHYGSVDDRPYGGGAGMILRVEPIYKALQSVIPTGANEVSGMEESLSNKQKIVLTSPKGKIFNQKKADEYSKLHHLVIIAGHYEDVDARILDYVDEEVSMGDFVMTGGEITASAIVDAVTRLIPGVLKKNDATKIESFFSVLIYRLIDTVGEDEVLKKLREKGIKEVQLLEYPQYTRPEEFMGKKVPEILLQGNHKEIEKWKIKKAYEETLKKRPEFLNI